MLSAIQGDFKRNCVLRSSSGKVTSEKLISPARVILFKPLTGKVHEFRRLKSRIPRADCTERGVSASYKLVSSIHIDLCPGPVKPAFHSFKNTNSPCIRNLIPYYSKIENGSKPVFLTQFVILIGRIQV